MRSQWGRWLFDELHRVPWLHTIQNSTIAGNTVVDGGDGAFSFQGFNPSLQTDSLRVVVCNSTIARNTANDAEVLSFGAFTNANPLRNHRFNGSLIVKSQVLGGRHEPLIQALCLRRQPALC